MASRFCDSFEHYDSAHARCKWTNSGPAIQGGGRNGNCGVLGAGAGILKTLTPQTSWTVGWAYLTPAKGQGYIYQTGVIDTGHNQVALASLYLEQDNTFTVYAGNTVIAHTTFAIQLNIWYYLEFQVTFSGSSPISATCTFRVNGNQLVSGTASTGSNATNVIGGVFSGSNWHSFSATNALASQLIDDLYIVDGTGATNTTFLGDVKILALYSAADTATVQWTTSSGSAHWSLVNETPPDDDSTYVKTNTVNNIDSYTPQTLAGFTGTIPFVHFLLLARKDDEGTRSFKHTVDSTPPAVATEFFPSDEYTYYHIAMDVDPTTTVAWTVTSFNARKFGIKLIS